MTWMIIRLILSLGFIAVVLFYAARLAKKRGLGQGNGLIEVVARQRMGRTSTVNVVRIADIVLVVGATEEQVTLLAEVDAETIDLALSEARGPVRLGAAEIGRPAPRRRSPPGRRRARWPARSSTATAGAPSCTSCASGRSADHDGDRARVPRAAGPIPASRRPRPPARPALHGGRPAARRPGVGRARRPGGPRPRRSHRSPRPWTAASTSPSATARRAPPSR